MPAFFIFLTLATSLRENGGEYHDKYEQDSLQFTLP